MDSTNTSGLKPILKKVVSKRTYQLKQSYAVDQPHRCLGKNPTTAAKKSSKFLAAFDAKIRIRSCNMIGFFGTVCPSYPNILRYLSVLRFLLKCIKCLLQRFKIRILCTENGFVWVGGSKRKVWAEVGMAVETRSVSGLRNCENGVSIFLGTPGGYFITPADI